MVLNSRTRFAYVGALLAWVLWPAAPLSAQTPSLRPLGQPVFSGYAGYDNRDYVVGPHDVLAIALRGEPRLTGRFTVETDRTFIYHHIGRVRAGGLTLWEVEAELRNRLMAGEFFEDPQITVTVAQYRSQKIFVVGAVRTPGEYTLSGDMRLGAALTLAGSTLPTAADEVVIVPAGSGSLMVTSSAAIGRGSPEDEEPNATPVTRVNLRQMRGGPSFQNVALRDGDTVFVLRTENIYLSGQVRNPGTYALRQGTTTVSHGLALAGGVTPRGETSRVEIVRNVNGERKTMQVDLSAALLPGDTIVVPERF